MQATRLFNLERSELPEELSPAKSKSDGLCTDDARAGFQPLLDERQGTPLLFWLTIIELFTRQNVNEQLCIVNLGFRLPPL